MENKISDIDRNNIEYYLYSRSWVEKFWEKYVWLKFLCKGSFVDKTLKYIPRSIRRDIICYLAWDDTVCLNVIIDKDKKTSPYPGKTLLIHNRIKYE